MDGWLYLSRYSARISVEKVEKDLRGPVHRWQFPSYSCHRSRTGVANLWGAWSQRQAERYSWYAAFNAVRFFLLFYPTSFSILGRICAYAHISSYVETANNLPLLPNNTASETFLHKSGAVRSADWIFIVGAPAWRWLREYVAMEKRFYNFIFKQKAVAAPVTSTFSSLSHFSRRPIL